MRGLDQRILIAAKRSIGDARKLAPGGQRRRRQGDWHAKPPPRKPNRDRGCGVTGKSCGERIGRTRHVTALEHDPEKWKPKPGPSAPGVKEWPHVRWTNDRS